MTFAFNPTGIQISSSFAATSSFTINSDNSPTNADLAGFALAPPGPPGQVLTVNATIVSI